MSQSCDVLWVSIVLLVFGLAVGLILGAAYNDVTRTP